MSPSLQLTESQLGIVLAVLRQHAPDREVRVFGSRARGDARRMSDLDLALMGDHPLPLAVLADLREAFAESDLSFRVDLLDWARTSDHFRGLIKEEGIVIHEGRLP
ncbi:MAG: nucleotidyltransferase domain-containing protein [bacterium]|jgi:type I restriction enzyme S subunit|nr:nucleotidyltransferase domain-containing protein [bacterium]